MLKSLKKRNLFLTTICIYSVLLNTSLQGFVDREIVKLSGLLTIATGSFAGLCWVINQTEESDSKFVYRKTSETKAICERLKAIQESLPEQQKDRVIKKISKLEEHSEYLSGKLTWTKWIITDQYGITNIEYRIPKEDKDYIIEFSKSLEAFCDNIESQADVILKNTTVNPWKWAKKRWLRMNGEARNSWINKGICGSLAAAAGILFYIDNEYPSGDRQRALKQISRNTAAITNLGLLSCKIECLIQDGITEDKQDLVGDLKRYIIILKHKINENTQNCLFYNYRENYGRISNTMNGIHTHYSYTTSYRFVNQSEERSNIEKSRKVISEKVKIATKLFNALQNRRKTAAECQELLNALINHVHRIEAEKNYKALPDNKKILVTEEEPCYICNDDKKNFVLFNCDLPGHQMCEECYISWSASQAQGETPSCPLCRS